MGKRRLHVGITGKAESTVFGHQLSMRVKKKGLLKIMPQILAALMEPTCSMEPKKEFGGGMSIGELVWLQG